LQVKQSAIFVGREAEMNQIREICGGDRQERSVVIWARDGMGKTRLAEEAARELKSGFPGGVEFIHLRGYTARTQPATLDDAAAHILRKLNVDEITLATWREEGVLLKNYQKWLSDHKVLLILDGACAGRGFEALMPERNSAAILTTRDRLNEMGGRYVTVALRGWNTEDVERFLSSRGNSLLIPYAERITKVCGYPFEKGVYLAWPLAVNLLEGYARQAGNMTPERVISKFEKRPEKGSTLANSAWRELDRVAEVSVNALSAKHLRWFAGLSVFPGWFDSLAVHEILEIGEEAGETFIQVLQSRCLLEHEERTNAVSGNGKYHYYYLPNFIRDYADRLLPS
jgi:hypothetical protein